MKNKISSAESRFLNKAKREMPPPQPEAPAAPKRGRGRPSGGKATFSQERIKLLPEVGTASEVAAALGVQRMSVRQWCKRKSNPLPSVVHEGKNLFRRDVVIRWLESTCRYTKRKAKKGKKRWRASTKS